MSDMYDWITAKNINPLAGRCLHECSYCYALNDRKPNMKAKYSGQIRLDKKVLCSEVKGGMRFLCSCNDLFAEGVPKEHIAEILDWAEQQITVEWAIQTKNPQHPIFQDLLQCCPANFTLGITLETNRDTSAFSKAPPPVDRWARGIDYITIEPMLDFDIRDFVFMIKTFNPDFVNIGADSGHNNLPEPNEEKILALIAELEKFTEVKIKSNLARIAPGA